MEAPVIEEPTSRTTTILGSFLRGRPRNISQSHTPVNTEQQHRELSPIPPPPPSPGGRRRPPLTQALSSSNTTNNSSGSSGSLAFSNMLRRRRSAGNVASPAAGATAPAVPIPVAPSTTAPASSTPAAAAAAGPSSGTPGNGGGSSASHRIRLVPHIDNRRNLRFEAITRDLKEGDSPLRIGRFTDRSGLGLAAVNAMNSNKLAFKSKVVSRAHAEIWVEHGGKFLIKDTKSSSGTFLNHIRLSPANTESKPFQLKDGDILQLGVDYQGGTEDIYKSVKIRLELGREWQATANAFNTNAIKSLKALAGPLAQASKSSSTRPLKTQLGDCCICLFPVAIRQSLFITPCSHTFHYKCIRPLLESHHPGFCCPLCRTFADLEEDVEVDGDLMEVEEDEEDDGVSEVGLEGGDAEAGISGGLAPPAKETGAETEVEGEGGNGGAGPSRMRVSTPLTDDVQEEDVVLVERVGSDLGGPEEAMEVDGAPGADAREMGSSSPMDDVDGTVGGKRKR
ncbi:cytoplasmic protein [Coprinopsis sp. MPI-PUGE-AT-0042]|nr:cytoplasmic protein [Coprinopsis sp. MPI-PUGE-AT-0042]